MNMSVQLLPTYECRVAPVFRMQRGFTLVEMAIVLIVVGIILAGILNGQGMVESSRAKDVVAIIDDLRTATSYFKQRYRYLPGDLPTPATDMTVVPALVAGTGTNGDGLIDGAINAVTGLATAGSEVAEAPWHLFNAGFIGKIAGGAAAPATQRRLSTFYGAVHIASAATANGLVAGFAAANPAARNAIVFQNLSCEVVTEVDNKIDDGVITGGRAMAAAACVSDATVPWYAVAL